MEIELNSHDVTEYTFDTITVKDGATMIFRDKIFYTKKLIVEGTGDIAAEGDALIVVSEYTNVEGEFVAKRAANEPMKNYILAVGNMSVKRNGKHFVSGNFESIKDTYLTQGYYEFTMFDGKKLKFLIK